MVFKHCELSSYKKTTPHFSHKERRKIAEKSYQYSWIDNNLFYVVPDQVMRRCVREDEVHDILHACHDEPCRGHFVEKRIALKILTMEYYWPTLHKDAMT